MGSAIPVASQEETLGAGRSRPARYLTYSLNRVPFACAISRVQEVMTLQPILSLPGAPSFVRGAICVRQGLLPVIDLRLKLGLPARAPNQRNCILLLRVGEGLCEALVGVIVDSVSEVVEVHAHQVREAPEAPRGVRPGLVSGTIRIRGRLTRLLDVDVLLTSEERTILTSLYSRA